MDSEATLTAEDERKIRGVHAIWQATLAAQRMPRTDEQLHMYIKALCGFHIPRVAPTEGQQAPFDFVADAFFGRFERALIWAARGAGKTQDTAILNLLASKFHPATHTAHFGAVGRQAFWGFGYLQDLAGKPWFAGDVVRNIGSVIQWRNGSWVMPLSGHTPTGVTAIRANRLVQDEIDLWDMSIFETSQMMVQGTEQNPAQRIFISTQYTAYGLMSQLLREAPRRGYRTYKWDVWASLKRCKECLGKECPLYIWVNPRTGLVEPLCRGRGLLADGYVPLQAAIDEYMATDPTDYQVQKLLEEPEREYLVLPTFDERFHVGVAPPEAFGDEAVRTCGVDPGFDHPLVFAVLSELPNGDIWGIHEHGERFASPSREAEIAKEINTEFGPLIFYVGHAGPETVANLSEEGLSAAPCPIVSRDARHRATRTLLARDPETGSRLKFDKDKMPVTIWQMGTVHRDPRTGVEVKDANDYFDANEAALCVIAAGGSEGALIR